MPSRSTYFHHDTSENNPSTPHAAGFLSQEYCHAIEQPCAHTPSWVHRRRLTGRLWNTTLLPYGSSTHSHLRGELAPANSSKLAPYVRRPGNTSRTEVANCSPRSQTPTLRFATFPSLYGCGVERLLEYAKLEQEPPQLFLSTLPHSPLGSASSHLPPLVLHDFRAHVHLVQVAVEGDSLGPLRTTTERVGIVRRSRARFCRPVPNPQFATSDFATFRDTSPLTSHALGGERSETWGEGATSYSALRRSFMNASISGNVTTLFSDPDAFAPSTSQLQNSSTPEA